MQTLKIKFTKIEVPDFEKKGFLPVRFHYKANEKDSYVETQYGYIKEDPTAFAEDIIAQVRQAQKRKFQADPKEDGVLAGHVNVLLDEDFMGQTTDKVSNALKHIRDKVSTLKGMATSNNYINKYVEIRGLIIDL